MKRILFLIAFLWCAGTAQAATYWASPTGGAATCAAASGASDPGVYRTVAQGIACMTAAGDELNLTNGTYTGASGMITISAKDCTSVAPCTIRAVNDGAVLIDGQNARGPVNLSNSDWWILEGFNAANSNATVVIMNTGADDNIIRRVCAWNAPATGNFRVWGFVGNRTLVEDSCGFGSGRAIFQISNGGDDTILRRTWGAFETDTSDTGPEETYHFAYQSTRNILENTIAQWHQVGGAVNAHGLYNIGSEGAGHKLLGSIGYVRSTDTYSPSRLVKTDWNVGANVPTTIKDMVLYTEQASKQPFNLVSQACVGCLLHNTTEIGGVASSIGAVWNITNRVDVDTVGAAPNIWNGSGSSGARVCTRYVGGTLTSQPLWPWPMDARINAALTASGRNPNDYFGTGNTLTTYLESVFGTIPAQCLTTVTQVANYEALEIGTQPVPTAWNSAAFLGAQAASYIGAETGGSACGGQFTHKMLWQNAATPRLYHSFNCALDVTAVIGSGTEDDAAIVQEASDKVDIRWKNNQTSTCDSNTLNIVANLFPTFVDRDCTGGTFTTTRDINVTVLRNIVSNVSWNLFVAHDVGFAVTPDMVVNANFGMVDRNGSSSNKLFNGTALSDLTNWGTLKFSSATVPPPPLVSATLFVPTGGGFAIGGGASVTIAGQE